MKNIFNDNMVFFIIIWIFSSIFVIQFIKKISNKVPYNGFDLALNFCCLFFGLFYINWIFKTEISPIILNTFSVLVLTTIFAFFIENKRKISVNILLVFGFSSLALGFQFFITESLKNINPEEQLNDIKIKNDIQKQKKLDEKYSYEEQIAIADFNEITKINASENQVYFEEFIKYKDTVCSSKLSNEEKKMRLISFKISNLKDVIIFVNEVKEINTLLDKLNMHIGMIKKYSTQYSEKENKNKFKKYTSFLLRLENSITEFDDCHPQTGKGMINLKDLLAEEGKASQILSAAKNTATEIIVHPSSQK